MELILIQQAQLTILHMVKLQQIPLPSLHVMTKQIQDHTLMTLELLPLQLLHHLD